MAYEHSTTYPKLADAVTAARALVNGDRSPRFIMGLPSGFAIATVDEMEANTLLEAKGRGRPVVQTVDCE